MGLLMFGSQELDCAFVGIVVGLMTCCGCVTILSVDLLCKHREFDPDDSSSLG